MKLFFLTLHLLLVGVIADTECPTIDVTAVIKDRRTNKSLLRVMQYNVEWLYTDYYANAKCPGTGCTWHSLTDAETHLAKVASVINALNPDIVNLCEVEGCDELQQLISQTNNSYVSYLIQGTDTSTGQNVGMLTKVDPVTDLVRSSATKSYPIFGTNCGDTPAAGHSGVSKHYISEFVLNDSLKLAIIGAHLLAYPLDPSRCVQREAQAQVLSDIVSSYVAKEYEVILLGDFNDYDGKVSDINGNQPNSRVLDILKGVNNTYQLTSAAEKITNVKERYTDWYNSDNNCNTSSTNDLSMIDHVLVTPKVFDSIVSVYVYHGYNIYCDTFDSDHWPVVVDIQL